MKRCLTLIQILVTMGCFVWLWSRPEVSQGILEVWGAADPLWLGAGLLVALIMVGLGILRWQLFLRIQGIHISLLENTKLSLIGGFFNLVLIGTIGGDAIKILYLIKLYPNKKGNILLSVLMDRLTGLAAVTGFFVAFPMMRHAWFEPSGLSFKALVFTGGYLAFTLSGVGFTFIVTKLGVLHHTPKWVPFRKQCIAFSEAHLLFLKHWRASLIAVGLSFGIHFTYFASYYVAGQAMRSSFSFLDTMTLMPVIDLITTLPISISGLGLREGLFEEFLPILSGIPRNVAVSISLLGFGFSVFWSLAGALVFPFYRPKSEDGSTQGLREVIREAKAITTE